MGRFTDLSERCPQCVAHGCVHTDGSCTTCKECNPSEREIDIYSSSEPYPEKPSARYEARNYNKGVRYLHVEHAIEAFSKFLDENYNLIPKNPNELQEK